VQLPSRLLQSLPQQDARSAAASIFHADRLEGEEARGKFGQCTHASMVDHLHTAGPVEKCSDIRIASNAANKLAPWIA
jgi:hypothetical protein